MTNKKRSRKKAAQTGGAYGGDFVEGDQIVHAERGGIAIGGSVSHSTLNTGFGGAAGSDLHVYFVPIYERIRQADLPAADRVDLQAEVQELEAETAKGNQADESFLARRLRSIRRMAPEILEVILATLSSPAAGFSMVVRKVAEKMKAEASE